MSAHHTLHSSWVIQSPNQTDAKEVYERPLGLLEQVFYWDSNFAGTADTLQHAEFTIDGSRLDSEYVMGFSNISRIWAEIKQQFPLLGARIEERDKKSIFFVVANERLSKSEAEEVVIQDVESLGQVEKIVENTILKERRLSNHLLARLLVLRRTDAENTFHVAIHVAHVITDGMSNNTILKTFLNKIASDKAVEKQWDIHQRLTLSESTDHLYPYRKFSMAKQRWRWATARIILTRRPPLPTRQAGHSLPRKISQQTPYTPALSRKKAVTLSLQQSQTVISSCRQHRLTFGNVYPIIGQIAVTRLLLKLYLRGEISEEEWAWRKREPMFSAGPMNIRPFQDKAWIAAGGLDHVCLSIGFFFYALPVMPLGRASSLQPGAGLPSFDILLSRKRFWLRSRSIRKQAENFVKNPLLLEMGAISLPGRVQRAKDVAVQWRTDKGPPAGSDSTLMTAVEQASKGIVLCNGGSSMGNVDLLLSREYPLHNRSEKPAVQLQSNSTMLHCRPAELYLGASTSAQQLRLIVYWDNNVFEESLISKWLDEVKNAIDFYLGSELDMGSKM